ncbi:hypothetical protein L0U88_20470 [Flavihumibacter sp. RY-1]|uniref:Uncharacterized protein n=1 Tax=Flavihumibacter fluminis TaxID=2909236 RepID=A0ABS9BMT0_9BACT|nr:hypothetical protein [Flavihumibacter fluminis]MCF1717029.1 hypothetical protein [Flavihumibacter fluminis]
MKLLCSIILIILLTFCDANKKLATSNDVLIVLYPKDFNGTSIDLNYVTKPVKFSKVFWDYFITSHPRIAMTIFGHHMYAEHYPYFIITDTLFEYFPIDPNSKDLSKLTSDSPGGTEKEASKTETIWKNGLRYKPQPRTVDENVKQEFDRFKKILSYRDEQNYYVLIYKKHIVESILH